MERLTFTHSYDGRNEGQATQSTRLYLAGALGLENAIELFKHFCGTVYGKEITVEIEGDDEGEKSGEATVDAMGFDLGGQDDENGREDNEQDD